MDVLTSDPLGVILSRSYIFPKVVRYRPEGAQRFICTLSGIQNLTVSPMNGKLQIIKPPAAYLESSMYAAMQCTSAYQRNNLEV